MVLTEGAVEVVMVGGEDDATLLRSWSRNGKNIKDCGPAIPRPLPPGYWQLIWLYKHQIDMLIMFQRQKSEVSKGSWDLEIDKQ